jgi:hypothetical protein
VMNSHNNVFSECFDEFHFVHRISEFILDWTRKHPVQTFSSKIGVLVFNLRNDTQLYDLWRVADISRLLRREQDWFVRNVKTLKDDMKADRKSWAIDVSFWRFGYFDMNLWLVLMSIDECLQGSLFR